MFTQNINYIKMAKKGVIKIWIFTKYHEAEPHKISRTLFAKWNGQVLDVKIYKKDKGPLSSVSCHNSDHIETHKNVQIIMIHYY